MAPLIILIVFLGVYPKPVLDRITPSVNQLVTHVETTTGTTEPPVAVTRRGRCEVIATPRSPTPRAPRTPASDTIAVRPIRYLAILPVIIMLGGAVSLLGAGLAGPPAAAGARCRTVGHLVISRRRAGPRRSGSGPTCAPRAVHLRRPRRRGRRLQRASSWSWSPVAMLLTALVADGYLRREGISGAEFHVLALVSASGAMLMAQANDLIIVFLGLEILSIALYVLAALQPPAGRLGRGGAEVLRPRRLLLGDLRLRHRPHLRGDRLDQPDPDRRLPLQERRALQRPAARRARPVARRLRLQGRGGAVPHVDARRLPGGAVAR